MSDSQNTSPLLPPEPWYTSDIFWKGLLGAAAQITSLGFRIAKYFNPEITVPIAEINAIAADLTQVVALILGVLILKSRANSKIQPLTLNKASAEAKKETALLDPKTMAPKEQGAAGLAAAQEAGKQPDTAAIERGNL